MGPAIPERDNTGVGAYACGKDFKPHSGQQCDIWIGAVPLHCKRYHCFCTIRPCCLSCSCSLLATLQVRYCHYTEHMHLRI